MWRWVTTLGKSAASCLICFLLRMLNFFFCLLFISLSNLRRGGDSSRQQTRTVSKCGPLMCHISHQSRFDAQSSMLLISLYCYRSNVAGKSRRKPILSIYLCLLADFCHYKWLQRPGYLLLPDVAYCTTRLRV